MIAGDEAGHLEVGDSVPEDLVREVGQLVPETAHEAGPAPKVLDDAVTGPRLTGASSDMYDILAGWNDKAGRYVLERKGYYTAPSYGFGWRKAWYKHDLGTGAIKTITKKYYDYYNDGGTRWIYRTTFNYVVCRPTSGCITEDTLTARAVMDRGNYDGAMFGLITAYCEGYSGKCPAWAKNAR